MISLDIGASVIAGIIVAIAVVILLILYFKGVFRHRQHYQIFNVPSPDAPNFGLTIAGLSDSFITSGEITGFWVEADQIQPARLEAIQRAQHTILFETYKMSPGERADAFAAALMERSQAGVKVMVLVDAYGARSVPKRYWKQLESNGIEVRFFQSWSWRSPLDYLKRSHRKLLLIDDEIVLIGGAGISDDWDGVPEQGDKASWRDFEVRFQGAVVSRLKSLFLQHWLDAGETVDLKEYPIISATASRNQPTMLVTSGEDPSYRDSSIRSLYQTLIMAATRRVWIASPYFLPFFDTRQLLIAAKQRGVDVRILTMSEKTDKLFVCYAGRELYRELLSQGVEIYEYQLSMMHGKVMLIDDQWVSLGSANFDPRSFWQNDELNLSTAQLELSQQVRQFLQNSFSQSRSVTKRDLKRRSLREKLVGKFALIFYWQL